MKLTKLQRYTLYCIMLHEAEMVLRLINYSRPEWYLDHYWGLCEISYSVTGDETIIHDLPELIKRKPNNTRFFWFSSFTSEGWLKRIEILKQCIEETHP